MFGEYGDINQDKLKVFYDAEFTGLHQNTTLISIGLLTENGEYFYAEFTDYDQSQCDDWIKNNVIDNLILKHGSGVSISGNNIMVKGPKSYVKGYLLDWLSKYKDSGKHLQFYSDCYAYDWMLFNDLICDDGKALNLPNYIYYIPMDLSTTMQMHDVDPDITREEFIGYQYIEDIKQNYPFNEMGDNFKHNSLWDAYVCRACFSILMHG